MNNIKAVLGKPYDRLTKKQKLLYDELVKRFINGDRLYGSSIDSTDHLGWAIGLAVALLRKAAITGEPNQTMFIELSIDERGISVTKPVIDFTKEETEDIMVDVAE